MVKQNKDYPDEDDFINKTIEGYSVLPDHKQQLLAIRYSKSVRDVEKKKIIALLILHNQRLIAKLARKMAANSKSKIGFADLMHEGVIGAITAIQKYNHKKAKGAKITTFMWWWVRHYMQTLIQSQSDIKVPRNRLNKVKTAWFKAFQDGIQLSVSDISELCGISIEEANTLWANSGGTASLNQVVFQAMGQKEEYWELVKYPGKGPEEITEEKLNKERIIDVLKHLSKNDARFIRIKYGLEDGIVRTRTQMAQLYRKTENEIVLRERRILDFLKALLDREDFNL